MFGDDFTVGMYFQIDGLAYDKGPELFDSILLFPLTSLLGNKTQGIGEDQTSGTSALQSINNSSLDP